MDVILVELGDGVHGGLGRGDKRRACSFSCYLCTPQQSVTWQTWPRQTHDVGKGFLGGPETCPTHSTGDTRQGLKPFDLQGEGCVAGSKRHQPGAAPYDLLIFSKPSLADWGQCSLFSIEKRELAPFLYLVS